MPKVARTQSSNSAPSDSPPEKMLRSLTPGCLTSACRISFSAVGGRNTLRTRVIGHQLHRRVRHRISWRDARPPARRDRAPETAHRTMPPIQAQSAGVHITSPGFGKEIVDHLDIGQMAEQHAMGVQRALRVARGARGVDDDGGIVGRGIDGSEVGRGGLERRPERFGARGRIVADEIDILSSGSRSRIFFSFSQPAASVTMALAPELARRNSSASSPNSANSGIDTMPERNAARCAIGNSSDCDRNSATRSPRTRPSATSTLAKRRDMSRNSSNDVRVTCRPRRHRSAPDDRCHRRDDRNRRSRC